MSKYSTGIVELLCEQLRVHEQNLAKLELQAARHGMDVPLALQNQIDFEIQKIEELRRQLAEVEAGPSAAEEEAAVPLWQRLPVWGWAAIGGVVLILVTGAFLAGRGAKLVPTPTAVAEMTTPAATSAAMPRPTATPVAPTFTPLPPIATPVPPTATPVPTSTPRPTATPVPPTATPVLPTATPAPTATPDLTVHDSFDDPSFNGSFNWNIWQKDTKSVPSSRFVQQAGILIVTQDGILNDDTRLVPRKYNGVTLSGPTLFEAKLRIEPTKNAGWVIFDSPEAAGVAACRIDQDANAFCEYVDTTSFWDPRYVTEYRSVGDGQLHALRIDVDPATMAFTYYLDGQVFGSYTSLDAEKLKNRASFRPTIGVANWGWDSSAAVVGYIDDVRIEPAQ